MKNEKELFMELYRKVRNKEIDPRALDEETIEKVKKMIQAEIEIRNEELIKDIEECKRLEEKRKSKKSSVN